MIAGAFGVFMQRTAWWIANCVGHWPLRFLQQITVSVLKISWTFRSVDSICTRVPFFSLCPWNPNLSVFPVLQPIYCFISYFINYPQLIPYQGLIWLTPAALEACAVASVRDLQRVHALALSMEQTWKIGETLFIIRSTKMNNTRLTDCGGSTTGESHDFVDLFFCLSGWRKS